MDWIDCRKKIKKGEIKEEEEEEQKGGNKRRRRRRRKREHITLCLLGVFSS